MNLLERIADLLEDEHEWLLQEIKEACVNRGAPTAIGYQTHEDCDEKCDKEPGHYVVKFDDGTTASGWIIPTSPAPGAWNGKGGYTHSYTWILEEGFEEGFAN